MNKKYRKALIAGNWKMNMLPSEVKPFVEALKAEMPKQKSCDVAICAPFVVMPALMKATGGSRYAERGAMAGLILGIIFTPVGMILGSFLGAFLSELYWGKKSAGEALKAAVGSFLGFITGTGLKTIVSCIIMWKIIIFAF